MKKTISRPHDKWGKIQRESLKYLKGNDLRVYADLLTYANSNGQCWPSVGTIGKDLGMHSRNVQKNLANLERDGWIEKHLRKDTSTIYQIYHVKVNDKTNPDTNISPNKKSDLSVGVAKSTVTGVAKITVPEVAITTVSGVADSTTLTDHLTDQNNKPQEHVVTVVSNISSNDTNKHVCSHEERKLFSDMWLRYSVPNEHEGSAFSAWRYYCSFNDPKLLQHIKNLMSNKTGTYMTNQMKQAKDDYYKQRELSEKKRISEIENKKNPEQSL